MNPETITTVMTRRRSVSTAPAAPSPIAAARLTLQISCTICGSRSHDKQRCSLAILDEKTGEAS